MKRGMAPWLSNEHIWLTINFLSTHTHAHLAKTHADILWILTVDEMSKC